MAGFANLQVAPRFRGLGFTMAKKLAFVTVNYCAVERETNGATPFTGTSILSVDTSTVGAFQLALANGGLNPAVILCTETLYNLGRKNRRICWQRLSSGLAHCAGEV